MTVPSTGSVVRRYIYVARDPGACYGLDLRDGPGAKPCRNDLICVVGCYSDQDIKIDQGLANIMREVFTDQAPAFG